MDRFHHLRVAMSSTGNTVPTVKIPKRAAIGGEHLIAHTVRQREGKRRVGWQ